MDEFDEFDEFVEFDEFDDQSVRIGEGQNLNNVPAPSECLCRFTTIRNISNIASSECQNPPVHGVRRYPSICAICFEGANSRMSSDPMHRGVPSPR